MLLTPEEVAQMLRVSKRTVYRYAKRGDLEITTIGKTVRFPADQFKSILGVDIKSEVSKASEAILGEEEDIFA
jgi:excisionase family DNA binding protein